MDEIKAQYASLRPPESPPRRRFITSDTTIEKASELMKDNPRGLTILRDELVGLLVTWDREDRKDDRCFHLQGWNGYGSYTSDRIGRGTIDTPQLCEVIFGGIQPSRFLVYLKLARNNIENDGLLQRFQLLVDPDELAGKPEIVDEYPDQKAKDQAFTIIEKLSEMDFIECGGQIDEFTKIPYFHFSPAAQVFFNNWLLALETKLRGSDDDPIMAEHLSKYPKLMPSLALIFHLVEVADKALAGMQTVSKKTRAAAFADQPNEIPDAINLASRLEGLNKLYGTSIIASGTIVDRANEVFDFRLLDVVAVKGKSDPIKIYELLGTKGAFEHCRQVVSAYETAFSAYAAADFKRALAVLQENASDPPSTVLIERCKAFLQVPPPADWRGIYLSASK